MKDFIHVQIPCTELKHVLAGLARVIPRRATLPILGDVRIAAELDQITFTGTDLEQVAVYRSTSAKILRSGEAVIVEHEKLRSAIESAGTSDVVLEASAESMRVIRAVAGVEIRSELPMLDTADWPDLPATVTTEPVDGDFLCQLRRAAKFASKDESRRILNGVALERTERGHYLVATDGRRLTALNSMTLPDGVNCVTPVTKFLLASKLSGECRIGVGQHHDSPWFQLRMGAWTYMVRTIEGAYPNWRQVVPDEKGTHVLTFGDDTAAQLKQILTSLAIEDNNRTVALIGSKGGICVSAPSQVPRKDGGVLLPNTETRGAPITIGLCRDYLMDALEAGFHTFHCKSPDDALYAEDGRGGSHVLMPVRLNVTAHEADKPKTDSTPKKENEMKQEAGNPAPVSSTDKLLAAYEAARTKLREANDALASVAIAIKEALKEDKQRRAEIESVRSGLAKLKAIQV